MAPRLAPIPHVYTPDPAPDPAPKTTKAIAKLAKKKVIRIVAKSPIDDQFKARVTFSEAFGAEAGKVYSEPLQIDDLAAAAGQDFYWRCDIDQFRADPLLQGFETRWDILTAGWTFADGLGLYLYDEAICNPLSITRVIRAPASITVAPRFRVVATKKYRP